MMPMLRVFSRGVCLGMTMFFSGLQNCGSRRRSFIADCVGQPEFFVFPVARSGTAEHPRFCVIRSRRSFGKTGELRLLVYLENNITNGSERMLYSLLPSCAYLRAS